MTSEFHKVITPNDRGLNPDSHQSGIAFGAPSSRQKFDVFPELSSNPPAGLEGEALAKWNDQCMVEWLDPDGRNHTFRWIYYSNKFRGKTRNEYRITRGNTGDSPNAFLEHHDLRVGDTLVFSSLGDRRVSVRFNRVDRSQLELELARALGAASGGNVGVSELLDTERKAFQRSPDSLGTEEDKDDPSVGYIYVLDNPAMPGLVKIGFTTQKVEERARQLSGGSGVPSPFRVVSSCRVSDPLRLEHLIHKVLEPNRFNRNREFFLLDPQTAADRIEAIGALWSVVRPV